MNADPQIVQELVWSGRFSPGELLAAGAVLGGITLVLTWWGLRSYRRLFPVSAALRLAALGIVLWMLAEPVAQTTVTRTRSKAVVVLADASASMGVIDTAIEPAQAARWAAVTKPGGAGDVMFHIDGSRYALTASRDRLEQSARATGGDLELARKLAADSRPWLHEAKRQLDLLGTPTAMQGGWGPLPDAAMDEIRLRVDRYLIPKLAEWLDDLHHARPDDPEDPDGTYAELQRNLDRVIDDLAGAADAQAAQLAGHGQPAGDPATGEGTPTVHGGGYRGWGPQMPVPHLHELAEASRWEKIAGLLDYLEGGEFKTLARRGESPSQPPHTAAGDPIIRHAFDGEVFPWPGDSWAGLVLPPPSGGLSTGGRRRTESQHATDLVAALEQVELAGTSKRIEAAFLLTDGGHNAGGDPIARASNPDGPPIYIVPVGAATPIRDVALHHVQGPRRVMQNDLIYIEAMLDAYECAGEPLIVQLLHAEEVVDERRLIAPSDSFFTPLRFEHKAEEMGAQEFELRVEPLPDERTLENNQARLSVEVTEDRIRLLLADGLPRWEFRYLRNLFKRDERVEFHSILVDPAERVGDVGDLPTQLDDWSRYHAVVLGDLTPETLTSQHQQQLNEYVSLRGGTLILIAGERAMPQAYLRGPLEPLLPVEPIPYMARDPKGYRLVPTAEGRASEVVQIGDPRESQRVWSRLPLIPDVSGYCVPKMTSHVWMSLEPGSRSARPREAGETEQAFLCWHRVGRGRVVYLSAPASYLLRFRHGDRYHHRFWGQLLRWAMARELGAGFETVRLVTDKMRYQADDTVQVSLRLTHPNGQPVSGGRPTIEVLQEGEWGETDRSGSAVAGAAMEEDSQAPGHYRATLRDLPTGHLRIAAAGPEVEALLAEEGGQERVETEIIVEPPLSLELRDTRCNLPLLHRIAEASGGAVVPPTALPTVLAGLDLTPEVFEEVSRQALWPRWQYLMLFVGLVGVEWLIRKLVGLV